jgi:hypothetical protein
MHELASPAPVADAIAAALPYLRHFPEALDHGATLCFPTGESLFISAESIRATLQEATR